jgi:outer membrane scaffolding protein for murein synthesis (MipA/OmpV family)
MRAPTAALLWLAALPLQAGAWGTLLLIDAPPAEDTLAAGATLWSLPRSPGASHQDAALTPALDYYRHDGWFLSTETGAGYNFSRQASWQAGWRLWPQLGRARADEQIGSPRFGPRIQQEVFANVMINQALLLQTGVSYGAGRAKDGLQTEVGLTSGIPIGKVLLGIGAGATWGNRTYRHDYAGGSASGWADWSWTLSLDHHLDAKWHIDAQWQQAHLLRTAGIAGFDHPTQSTVMTSLWRDF